MKKILLALGFVACGAAMADAALEASIARGAQYLLAQQDAAGFWSDRQMPALTALPVWALSGCRGEAKVAQAISNGVAYVLSTQRADGGFYIPKPGRGGSGLGNYTVVGLCASHHIKGIYHRNAGGDVTTPRAHLAVFTTQPFCTDGSWTGLLILTTCIGMCLILSTYAIAIALVVVAHLYVRIPCGSTHSMTLANIAGSHQSKSINGSHFYLSQKVLLIVQVLAVDALSAHQCQLVVQLIV